MLKVLHIVWKVCLRFGFYPKFTTCAVLYDYVNKPVTDEGAVSVPWNWVTFQYYRIGFLKIDLVEVIAWGLVEQKVLHPGNVLHGRLVPAQVNYSSGFYPDLAASMVRERQRDARQEGQGSGQVLKPGLNSNDQPSPVEPVSTPLEPQG